MSYNRLRSGRVSIPQHYYFITIVTDNRIHWFNNLFLARKLISCMQDIDEKQLIKSISWVLMPDHLHWLFELGEKQSLSNTIGRFKGRSAKELNRQLNRDGRFWQPSFYDHALRKDEDIRKVARYITANPLRAGLVQRLGEYSHWDAIWL